MMTVTARVLQRCGIMQSQERATEEISLQATLKYSQRRCGYSDMI